MKALAWLRTATHATGSTRPIALIRIGLVLLLWARWGKELGLVGAADTSRLILGVLFFVFSFLTLIGFRTKIATLGLFLTLVVHYYVHGILLQHWEWTHHHAYALMVGSFVLAMAPSGQSYSVDRFLAVRAAQAGAGHVPAETGPLWAVNLLPVQMAALYFWAAVDKTDIAYLRGDWLARVMEWAYAGHPVYSLVTAPVFLITASVLVLLVEYYLAAAVLLRRWLYVTVPLGLGLHMVFATMLDVETYSLTMILYYLAVVPPGAVHRVIDTLGAAPQTGEARP